MFASLKNKIKEETGNDVCATTANPSFSSAHRRNSLSLNNFNNNNNNNNNNNHIETGHHGAFVSLHSNGVNHFDQMQRSSSTIISPIDQLNAVIIRKNAELTALNDKLLDLETKFAQLTTDFNELQTSKLQLEKTNCILEDALKVAQDQKELIHSEQDKIQNLQAQEISKLKSLLHFREQEAVDRLSTIKQKEHQLEQCQNENVRLREIEANFENVQDELEKVRHSTQLEKNSLTAQLASVEEQNRHLASKLQIYEEGRINFTMNQSNDEKLQTLLRERRMLEQRLEEAHLHLSDIKGTWSAQNMALETQVDRLSRQVAAETTEKRKALHAQDEYAEKCKQLAFQLEKAFVDIEQRDQKIKLLSEEIDDISSTYQEYKDQNEEEVTFLRNKVNKSTNEMVELKESLQMSIERSTVESEEADKLTKNLNGRIRSLQEELDELQNAFDREQEEKNSALLKTAEISQNEERLKQQLRNESHEVSELYETVQSMQVSLQSKTFEVEQLTEQRDELETKLNEFQQQINGIEDLKNEISDKNKTIKMLNQRLGDMKKTLQNELKSNGNGNGTSNGTILTNNVNESNGIDTDKFDGNNGKKPQNVVMDDVNFRYLKHVILKFLTSREVEARHLIRAIGTLLNLSADEEKLLHETLNFKVGWFGSRSHLDIASRNRHQKLFSIPSPLSS